MWRLGSWVKVFCSLLRTRKEIRRFFSPPEWVHLPLFFCHLWLIDDLRLLKRLFSIFIIYLYPTCSVNNTFSWTTCLLSAFVYMASAACKFIAYCVLGKMVCFLSNCYEAFRVSMGTRNHAKGWGKIPWTWYKKMVETAKTHPVVNRDGADRNVFLFIQFFCGVSSRGGEKSNR